MASVKYTCVKRDGGGQDRGIQLRDESVRINVDNGKSNDNGWNLFNSVKRRNVRKCQELLTPQNINTKDDAGNTLLHNLTKDYSRENNRSDEILSLLFRNGAKVEVKDKEGNTPLHIAAREGHEELCRKLIDHQKNNDSTPMLDMTNSKKMTSMHLAAQQGKCLVVALLMEEGARIDLRDNKRYLPLHYAAESGYPECCKLIHESYPKDICKDPVPLPPLMLAARGGHVWCCQNMKNLSQEDLDFQDKHGNTALHIACKNGYKHFVDQLVSMGANLDVQNKDGNTPVMNAISKNTNSCLTCLMDKGANLLIVNKENKGVLHLAAAKRADESMKLLLNDEGVKIRIDMKDDNGYSPLLIAIKKDCDKCSLMLLAAGASPKEGCKKKVTPLHLATETTSTEVLQKLLTIKELDLSPTDEIEKQTPLHYAAKMGSKEACMKLLRRGARISATDKYSRTALHISAYHGQSDIVKAFIKKGANLRALDDNKSTALHAAVKKGHLESCKIIVNAAKPLCIIKDHKGRYPLDVAFQKEHYKVYKFLLESLSFKSIDKLPPDLAKTLHAHTHKALKDENRVAAEIILKSIWWEVGLGISSSTKHEKRSCDNFRQIIKLYPDLAKLMMDNCETLNSKHNTEYNFKLLEDNYYIPLENENSTSKPTDDSTNKKDPFFPENKKFKLKPNAMEFIEDPVQWKISHPVQIMIHRKCLNLLIHPLVKSWLSYKWKTYIQWIFACLVMLQIFFVASLVGFLTYVQNWRRMSLKYNMSQEMFCQDFANMKGNHTLTVDDLYNAALPWHVTLFISTCLILALEFYNISKMGKYYLNGLTNLLRVASAILALVILVPYPSCGTLVKPVFPWQCGVVAFMLSCLCLINTINKMPSCAIFAILTRDFIKSYLKGLLLISMVILTFAFLFNLLLQDHISKDFTIVIVRTVVMVFGDYAYDDTFGSDQLPYPILANIFFIVFICLVGVFVVSLVKAPSSETEELCFNVKAVYADYMLTIDIIYSNLRKKHAIVKYCNENSKSGIRNKFEKLCTTMSEYLNSATDEEYAFAHCDEVQDKLDAQNANLDQILTLCLTQNEQIKELKQSYQMQNEQIADLKMRLHSSMCLENDNSILE